ncbi:hypothetical protein [Roseimaritima ulvae]|uniref:hypothetical protein n=1 Tax=Roseimaritima ulvae TaxID=980254 RepID=UPI0011CDF8EE|nr:hypothetical protein [Roseimaritima ulvae]
MSLLLHLHGSHAQAQRAAADETVAAWTLPDASQLAAQRDKIRQAMAGLDRLLQGTPEGPGWRTYLLWDSLQMAIADDVDDDTVLQIQAMSNLLSVYNRLADDYPSLELPEFQSLRSAIRPRIEQLNAILTRRGSTEAAARRIRLAELINVGTWTAQRQSEWSEHVRWLEDRLQTPPPSSLNASRPNLTLRISAPLIRNMTTNLVADPTDVNECIVGTPVRGSGVTSGQGWLSPDAGNQSVGSHGARLIVRFEGVLRTDTIGYSGPVQVFSAGHTRLNAHAVLQVNGEGLKLLSSNVQAAANSRTKGVSTKFRDGGGIDRLVKRIAHRQIADKKAQANWESSWKARKSFEKKFTEELVSEVQEGDQAFQEGLRLPLLRRDLFPVRWDWATHASDLTTSICFDGRSRATAATLPPTIRSEYAVNVLIHQSLFDNAVEGYLAGRLLPLDELGPQDDDDDSDPAGEADPASDVAVRLDDFQPLRCVLADNELTFYLLGRQFVAGGIEYPAAMIEIKYRLAVTGNTWRLERVAAPRILPTPRYSRKPRFGIGGAALRGAVEPALEQELPEQLELTIPALEAEIPEAVKGLQIVYATTVDGWLHIALD